MDTQRVKVAVVPLPPLKINGKSFDLKYYRLTKVIELLKERQHFQVIVYSELEPKGHEIPGQYNSDKIQRLLPYLRRIDEELHIDMPNRLEQLKKRS